MPVLTRVGGNLPLEEDQRIISRTHDSSVTNYFHTMKGNITILTIFFSQNNNNDLFEILGPKHRLPRHGGIDFRLQRWHSWWCSSFT
jgi:hypothetical protein